MRLIYAIWKNDLRRRLRSPLAIVLMMLIPLVLTLIIGLVFGRSGDVGLPDIRVLLADNDDGFLSNFLQQGLQQESLGEMITLVDVEEAEGLDLMERGKASAMIIVPEGFTQDLLDDRPVVLRVIKNPAESFLPMIVEEAVEMNALVLGGGMKIFAGPVSLLEGMFDADSWPSGGELQVLLDGAHDRLLLVNGYLSDSLITYETVQLRDDEEEEGFNLYAYILPGSMMIGLLFISQIVLKDLVREKDVGTIVRLFSAPLEAGHLIAAKILSAFTITGAACILLFLIGRFALGIDLGRPLPFVAQFAATILMCTGVIALFYGFLRTERAADSVSSVVIIVIALLGGSMLSYEMMGEQMQRVAHFSPVFWAIDGFKRIIIEDAGLAEIALNIIVLSAVSIATLVPGTLLLRRRFRRGG